MAGTVLHRKKFYSREWAFLKLAHCLEQRPLPKTRGAFIVGGPGSGKTSLCCEIVWPVSGGYGRQQRSLRRRLLAYHFCQAHIVSSLSVSGFVRSLVSQILGKGPESPASPTSNETLTSPTVSCRTLSQQYAEKIRNDPEIQAALRPDFLDRDPDEALRKGVLFPLLEIDPPKHCLFLLVDSIDENQLQSPGSKAHHEIEFGHGSSRTIAELLANHHHLFPQWLLLVCTARRHSKNISKMFTGFRKLSLDDLRKCQVVRDVQQYILARVDSEALRQHISRDTVEMLNQLHIKSNGCFLYLEKVLDGVAENFIVLREIREIPGTLNGLYLWLCQRLFHRKHFVKVQPLLNVILASRKPLTISEIYDAVWTSNINLTRQEFSKRLHLLRRIVHLSNDGTILLFHHSFAEWLLDVKHCTTKYLCSLELGHAMLAMSHSLKAKELGSEEIQNFALHLTRIPLPEDSVLNFIDKTLNFDYNTLLVLWLIQSGARVENCLLGEEKKDEVMAYLCENDLAKRIVINRKSLSRNEQRKQVDARNKSKTKKHSCVKQQQQQQQHGREYEEVRLEPHGRKDLEREKRIGEDYDHLDFDLKKPEKKTEPVSETIEVLEPTKLTNLEVMVIKEDEVGSSEAKKSPDLVEELCEDSFKFSEDASTLGVRSDGPTSLGFTRDDANEAGTEQQLSQEQELDVLLDELEKYLNEEISRQFPVDDRFPSRTARNALGGSRQEERGERSAGCGEEGKEKEVEKKGESEKETSGDADREVILSNLLDVLQVPKDPKVLRILTEAGAKVSNCNSLQREGKASGPGAEGDGVFSSQLTSPSTTQFQDEFQPWNKEGGDVSRMDSVGRTTIHALAGEGKAQKLRRVLASHPETELEAEDRHGQTALNLAARHGHLEVVETLLAAGADVNHADCEGWTALRAGAWGGHTAVVELLLKHGADVDVTDSDQRTALRAAAWGGHEDIVRLLVAHKANVNQTDDEGRTALIAASYMGHSDIVEHLLDHGAKVNHEDADKRTALSVATLCIPSNEGYAKVVNILLERGACVNHRDKDGMTPLLVAAFEGHRDVCELLLEYEADVDYPDDSGRTPLWAAASMGHSSVVELLLFWGCCVDSIDNEGRTVLSVAAAQGNTDVVRQLLDRGMDEQHRDNSGWTPLHYAAFEGHVEACEALLEAGAKVDEPDNEGKGPLMLAAQEGHVTLVEILLKVFGAAPDQRAHDGKTALRLAALGGHYDILRTLLSYGADVNIKDADGRSTLYILALENRLPMARYILEHGKADVETKDSEGRTPVHVSAWQGHCEMVSLLLSSGRADVNATDNENRTALHSASWQGHAPVVRLLLEHGATPDHTCNQGATALGIAAQEGHEACVRALLCHGADPSLSDSCGRNAFKVAAKSGHGGIVKLLEEHANDMKHRLQPGEVKLAPPGDELTPPPPPRKYSLVESPESTTHRQSLISLSNRSTHSKSSSNFTNSTKSSHEPGSSAADNSQGCLSFAQKLQQQCGRSSNGRPPSKVLSPLESEETSPIYDSPPHSPLSDINSPCEETKTQANAADLHFARDTHMRIILGNARLESGHPSSRPKRNGIVTNPALRWLESAAERIQKKRQEVSKFNHSKLVNSTTTKSNGYHWKKETPL